MFGKRKTSKPAIEAENVSPITMTLNGLKFVFDTQTNVWKVEKSELEKVAEALNQVLDERDTLLVSLQDAMQQIKDLNNEVLELNRSNKVALDLLKEEKLKTNILQQQVDGYRTELTNHCDTIAALQITNKS